MHARDVMTSPVFTISPEETVARARRLMVRHRISRLLVMEGSTLAGIITKKDIAWRLRQGEPSWRRRPLDKISAGVLATENPVTVAPDTTVRRIARLFVEKAFSSVPVIDGSLVAGIVTKTDLMKSVLMRNLRGTAGDAMEDVPVVNRYQSLNHVISVMKERNDKVLVCEKDGTPAGIITETNLALYDYEPGTIPVVGRDVTVTRRDRAQGKGGQGLLSVAPVTAMDVMTSPVVTTGPGTAITDVIAMMESNHVNSIVVMENGTISGIVKRDDIIKEVAK